MGDEKQQDMVNLHLTIPIPSIVVNRNDNREIGMNIENAENVTHNYTVELPSVSQATPSLHHDSSNPQGDVWSPAQPKKPPTSWKDPREERLDEFAPPSSYFQGAKRKNNHPGPHGAPGSSENVTHNQPVEQPSVSQATPSLHHDSSNPQGQVTHTVEQPSVSQATSSLQDMQINPQGSRGGVTARKPTIIEAFGPPGIGQLLQEQKYYKAYVISCRRISDLAVIGPNGLVDHYQCCMFTMLAGELEEAIRIKEQLKTLIREKFETTPNEIETFADTIRGEGRDMEAILFYQIAAEFYGNQSKAGHVTHTVEQTSVSQATSSLQDIQINPQGPRGGVRSRKPTIEEIFAPPDIGRLLQEQKYHEAYVISCWRMKFDPAVIGSKDLVNHYRCCMLVGEAEEAIRIKQQLKVLMKEKFQTTPNEIKTFADTIGGKGKDMEAILFYQIAAEFYGNQSKAGLVGIVDCACGIREYIEAMLSRDEGLNPIVRTHVIPLMREMRKMVRRSSDGSEEDRCLEEVRCLNRIEYSEYLVGDWINRKTTVEEAIAIMERVFKKRAGKYSVYGVCLNNLGATYAKTSRHNDAYQYFRKAIAAFGKAEDINDDQRAKYIANSKRNLERAKSQMK